ncbi:cytochrome b5-like heme/steroid binding domain-containing protein [Sporobolomyces salmoneus]|uniref:cytochrome b5-like heme/steroid binding domain-containing protein n=1 Tax=Sporobolomyces salmoneus TaxID=183962 RepID=UPI003180CBD1
MSEPTPPPPVPPVTPTPKTPAQATMKKANKPFLVHQNYKKRQAEEALRKKSNPTSSSSSQSPGTLFNVFKWTVFALSTSLVLSRAITQTWTWGYDPPPQLTSISALKDHFFPPGPLTLTEEQLSRYDGKQDPNLPIYLAIDGDVYDVTSGKSSYGPGGAYSIFSGRDAARAFVTGCFQTHLTHDLRGFTEKELATLKHWKQFYEKNAKYRKVGRVMHPPIDPSTPIPEPCTKAQGQPDSNQVGAAGRKG